MYFLLGNHKPYHLSLAIAKLKVNTFAARMKRLNDKSTIGKFVFLDQTRYDLTDKLTILGCTLFSEVTEDQENAVAARLVDFKDTLRWTVDDHNLAHQSDLKWLNDQVAKIEREELEAEDCHLHTSQLLWRRKGQQSQTPGKRSQFSVRKRSEK